MSSLGFLPLLLLLIVRVAAQQGYDEKLVRNRDHIEEILLKHDTASLSLSQETNRLRETHKFEKEVLSSLQDIYRDQIRPAERNFHYADLSRHHVLTDADIHSKPIVLLVGPWSSGKSTIINYILGTENTIEELYVGAEPTTSDFTVLTYGEHYRTVEGIVLATDAHKPFSSMEKFGQTFLEHLLGIEMPHPLLKNVTFIDTPGILENRRQQERGYPYNAVLRWLVNRADLIFVVFDPTKLDVGIELESLFKQLKGKESALRIILNKADSLNEQELMRVYGALFWSLAPLINVTEPPRIYVGSFWSKPYQSPDLQELLIREEKSLLIDMREVILNQIHNKIAFIRQHAIRVRIHALLVDSYVAAYRKNKGIFDGGEEIAESVIQDPDKHHVFKTILSHPNVSEYDLPEADEYTEFFEINPLQDQRKLSEHCSSWSTKKCPIDLLNRAIEVDLPDLLRKFQYVQISPEEDDYCYGFTCKTPLKEDANQEENYKTNKWRKTPPKPQEDVAAKRKYQKMPKTSGRGKTLSQAHSGSVEGKYFEDLEDGATQKSKIGGRKKFGKKKRGHKTYGTQTVSTEIEDEKDADDVRNEGIRRSPPAEAGSEKWRKSAQKLESKPGPLKHSTPAELGDKQRCKWRKSCYQTGTIPDLSHQGIFGKDYDDSDDEQHDDHEIPNDSAKLKEFCKWRKSCYETGKPPTLSSDGFFNFWSVTQEVSAGEEKQTAEKKTHKTQKKGERHAKAPKTKKADDNNDDDDDSDEMRAKNKLKQRCRWRKSCYDTGVFPDLSQTEIFSFQDWFKPQEPVAKGPESIEEKKMKCHFRKSCYEAEHIWTETKQAPKDKEASPGADKRKEKKTKTAGKKAKEGRAETTPPAPRKTHAKETKKQEPTQKTEPDKQEKDEEELRKEKSLKEICKWRKSCYESGIPPKIPGFSDLSPIDFFTSFYESLLNLGKAPADADDEKSLKEKCRWRKSCYGAEYKPEEQTKPPKTPQKEAPAKKIQKPTPKAQKSKEVKKKKQAAKPEPKQEAEDDKDEKEKNIKERCKWRKSCYETGILPEAQDSPPFFQAFWSASDSIDDVFQGDLGEKSEKEKCKWRKSCYDSGVMPNSEQDKKREKAKNKPQEKEERQKVVVVEEEVKEKDNLKERCKWRKSCYETGIVPPLEDSAASTLFFIPMASMFSEGFGSERQPISITNTKEACRWRKSCYPEMEKKLQQTKDSVKAVQEKPKQVPEKSPKVEEKPTKCSKYRKNCEQAEAEEQKEEAPSSEKCSKYRKSCVEGKESGGSSFPSASAAPVIPRDASETLPPEALFNDSVECNRWRLSCRKQLGLPPKPPKSPKTGKKKKLCRKKKPGNETESAEQSEKLSLPASEQTSQSKQKSSAPGK